MFVAMGVGAYSVGIFHLFTHAFFKALLFLGSGSVINGCHHEQDIFNMGGLRTRMKFTFATFTIGVLAIIGTPLLAGFFSKDAILYLAYTNNQAVFAVLAFAAILTAFYMVRMWKIVFFGAPRSEEADHAHEGGISLTAPLGVLAILAIVGGYPWFYQKIFANAFAGVLDLVPEAEGGMHWALAGLSVVIVLVGAGAAWGVYASAPTDSLGAKSPGLFGGLVALRAGFDRAYDYYVAKVQQRFAMLLNFLEQIFLAGLIVRGVSGVVGLFGLGARALHTGNLNTYVYWFLLGAAALWALAIGLATF
jgi:NADH-quinone oxidoreductase subunit L